MKLHSKFTGLALTAALSLGAVVGLAGPAQADPGGDTPTTFTLAGGALSISVPESANLGTAVSGASSIAGQLGSVTVVDERAALTPEWTATVASSDFSTGAGTQAETASAAHVGYESGDATSTVGSGVFSPDGSTNISGGAIAFSHEGGAGNNSATWNPTVSVGLNQAQVAGQYSGTITHSVA